MSQSVEQLYGFNDSVSFARKLREMRKRKGVTQESLAIRTGISRHKIMRMEQGKVHDMESVFRVLKELDLRVKLYEVELKVEEV